MEPIQNSVYKENLRQKNENEAREKVNSINSQLSNDIAKLPKRKESSGVSCIVIGIIAFIGLFGNGFLVALVGGIAVWLLTRWLEMALEKSFDANQEKQKAVLRGNAAKEIEKIYAEADRKTQKEIEQYDAEVKTYCQKILKNADNFTEMVEHQTNMFDRMISHADSGSNHRFIEADFIYTVNTYGISYSYKSSYSNSYDDYNFNIKRYRDLKSTAECEGLAQALAKMTIANMQKKYPPNSMNITVSHIDAQVTMHYKGANKYFVPARDIL